MRSIVCGLLLSVAACTSAGNDITWQLPCGADQFDDGASAPTRHQAFEYDGDGDLVHEVVTLADGSIEKEVHATYQDGQVTRWQQTGSNPFTETAEVSDGHVVTYDYLDQNGDAFDFSFHSTWTWDGDALAQITYDYVDPTVDDTTETYAATDTGFSYRSCSTSSCDLVTVDGADFVGDFDHYTRFAEDFGADGALDWMETRTLDGHGLELTLEDADATGAPYYQSRYSRDDDGTPRQFDSLEPGSGATVHRDYQFECATPAATRAPARLHLPGVLSRR